MTENHIKQPVSDTGTPETLAEMRKAGGQFTADTPLVTEAVNDGLWSLTAHFGRGPDARDAMRSWADSIRVRHEKPAYVTTNGATGESREKLAHLIAELFGRRGWLSMPSDSDKRVMMKSHGIVPPVEENELTIEGAFKAADYILAHMSTDTGALRLKEQA